MQKIKDGITRFQKEIFPKERQLFERLANSQKPQALVIACSDSRVNPNLITQTEPGDLFTCRNAGNIVPPYGEVHGGVSATIEYAVLALDIKNIVICGHSNCGAMKAILHPETLQNMPTAAQWLRHSDAARRVVEQVDPHLSGEDLLSAVTEQNVIAQLRNLTTHPSVISRLMSGELHVYGWVYDIHKGHVKAFDGESGRFNLVSPAYFPVAMPRYAALPLAV
jgi:carbonic anhydrase